MNENVKVTNNKNKSKYIDKYNKNKHRNHRVCKYDNSYFIRSDRVANIFCNKTILKNLCNFIKYKKNYDVDHYLLNIGPRQNKNIFMWHFNHNSTIK